MAAQKNSILDSELIKFPLFNKIVHLATVIATYIFLSRNIVKLP